MLNKKFFKDKGREGSEKRWGKLKNERKALIVEVSKWVDKDILDLIQAKLKNEDIIKLLKYWSKNKNGKE
jgi:hypothetical protein